MRLAADDKINVHSRHQTIITSDNGRIIDKGMERLLSADNNIENKLKLMKYCHIQTKTNIEASVRSIDLVALEGSIVSFASRNHENLGTIDFYY